ncbi:MAG: hypothetical protein K2K51_07290, partial [Bacteroidales bacterium]|nr:hypothetical protein [Bacteroidales bacterium]
SIKAGFGKPYDIHDETAAPFRVRLFHFPPLPPHYKNFLIFVKLILGCYETLCLYLLVLHTGKYFVNVRFSDNFSQRKSSYNGL